MPTTFLIIFYAIVAGLLGLFFMIDSPIDTLYLCTHLAIIGLGLLHIARMRAFNLAVTFSFFAIFFFGFIPLFEYKLNITYHGTATPKDTAYMTAAVIGLLSSVFFYIGYGLKSARQVDATALQPVRYLSTRHRQLTTIVTVSSMLVLAFFIALYHQFQITAMLFRGFGEEMESSAFGYSFVNFFARPLLFNLILLVALVRTRRRGKTDMVVYLLCGCLLLFISPLGVPRTLAGALYIPLLMLVFLPRLISKYGLLCLIVFAVIFAAPVADIFRVIQLSDQVDLGANFNLDYLFAGHFDAFYNLVLVVQLDFASSGWQTVGALLFWVPRAIWADKPLGTSFDFADWAGLRASNISFPLPAELYVDYRVLGVMLGMFVLGVVYRQIDRYLTRTRQPGSLTSYIAAIGHFQVAILGIYLLRGNFLSALAFTLGVSFTLVLIASVNGALRSQQKVRIAARELSVES